MNSTNLNNIKLLATIPRFIPSMYAYAKILLSYEVYVSDLVYSER